MIASLLAAAWYPVLVGGTALLGRPKGQTSAGQAERYELNRWRERTDHARRVRGEELAEMRRQAAH